MPRYKIKFRMSQEFITEVDADDMEEAIALVTDKATRYREDDRQGMYVSRYDGRLDEVLDVLVHIPASWSKPDEAKELLAYMAKRP